MKKSNECLGDFFTETFNNKLRKFKYSDIEKDLANMILEVVHKDQNRFYASPSWFDVSTRLNADISAFDDDQYNTWKREGFITALHFLTVSLKIFAFQS